MKRTFECWPRLMGFWALNISNGSTPFLRNFRGTSP